jgi:CheY-like chemotaxis protein
MPRRSRILIVDPNPNEIRLLESAFERARWMVDIDAIDAGHLAIDTMSRNYDLNTPTDLVMLSSSMGGESCLPTLRAIKNHPEFGYQPVIVFSPVRPARDFAHACSLLGALKLLEIPADLSHWILLEMTMTSRFPAEGQLTRRDTWINSNRLAVLKNIAGS